MVVLRVPRGDFSVDKAFNQGLGAHLFNSDANLANIRYQTFATHPQNLIMTSSPVRFQEGSL